MAVVYHAVRAITAPSLPSSHLHQHPTLADLEEEVDSPCVVKARRENHQQVIQQHGSEVQVKLNGFVVELNVGHLSTHKAQSSLMTLVRRL